MRESWPPCEYRRKAGGRSAPGSSVTITFAVARPRRLTPDARLATAASILLGLTNAFGDPGRPRRPCCWCAPAAWASAVKPNDTTTSATAVTIRLGPQTTLVLVPRSEG